ncbi:MAG: sacsin N-terminal ATP-binding-like domain-containing protein [Mycobacteriaceae bacterium]
MSDPADPFGTRELRIANLDSWKNSPTRFREDSAIEQDFLHGGYRDRLLTELAQNAADAAAKAGCSGSLWIDVEYGDSGTKLLVSNVGAPLDKEGVQALCALRSSNKSGAVGKFGVGFTSVLAVSSEIDILSISGSVSFSAEKTQKALQDNQINLQVRAPVLRLAWPSTKAPLSGADTTIVLQLNSDIDVDDLLSSMKMEALDILLELPILRSMTICGEAVTRREKSINSYFTEVVIGQQKWWSFAGSGSNIFAKIQLNTLVPNGNDVLRSPTRSDEELSLPLLIVTDVDMQPDRRRVLPGVSFVPIAKDYASCIVALDDSQRLAALPVPGFPRSAVDEQLRFAIKEQLSVTAWIPGCRPDKSLLKPDDAVLFPGLSALLAEVLAEVLPDLACPEYSHTAAAQVLASLGVEIIGFAKLIEALSGIDREPQWWLKVYEGLSEMAATSLDMEELAGIPVPLVDGRMIFGPKSTVVCSGLEKFSGELDSVLEGMRIVHPDVQHPLLSRLGSRVIAISDIFYETEFRSKLEHLHEESDAVIAGFSTAVLTLVDHCGEDYDPPNWLGSLLVKDSDDAWSRLDELLIPGAPIAKILINNSPFGLIDERIVAQFGIALLRRVGAVWTFLVVREDLPTGPDHQLHDESRWWNSLDSEPESFAAVQDLDLIGPDNWNQALSLLAEDENTRPLLFEKKGYTAWWLRNHAVVSGQKLGMLCAPDDNRFNELLDVFEHPNADLFIASLADEYIDQDMAQLLLDRLADPSRQPTPAGTAWIYSLITSAVLEGQCDLNSLEPPAMVRAIAGNVCPPADCCVLDKPWLAAVIPLTQLIVADIENSTTLADVLDVSLASEVVDGQVISQGYSSSWRKEPGAVLAAVQLGIDVAEGDVEVHEEIIIKTGDGTEFIVPWWVDSLGRVYVTPRWERPRVR